MFKDRLAAEIEHAKRTRFVQGSDPTDAEVMGLILAEYFRWDGEAVLKTAESALEDSNYHIAASRIASLRCPATRTVLPSTQRFLVPSFRDHTKLYEVILSGDSCTCPDFIYRPYNRPCKHIAGVRSSGNGQVR